MILYTTISTYVTDEIKKLNQRDTPTDWRNILAIDLMSDAETSSGLKRKLPEALCIQLYYKL